MLETLIKFAVVVLILCVLGYLASLLIQGTILTVIWVLLALVGCFAAVRMFQIKV